MKTHEKKIVQHFFLKLIHTKRGGDRAAKIQITTGSEREAKDFGRNWLNSEYSWYRLKVGVHKWKAIKSE